ncbi:MAG TPA: MBL fold metallo-hydrolase [Acidimicrobiales bacterium]|nr:MBL fold metallo-hydrolase [Acidimicrobiales bacterium]
MDVPPGGLSVTVLGCSGTYAGPGGACSGYLVRAAGTNVVVDLGSGTLANLQRHVALADVDAVVLSHEHPDHWLDLPVLRNALRYVLGLGDLPVYGTDGTRRLARAVMGEMAPTLRWTTVDEASSVEIGPLRLRFSATDHSVETLAVRADGGGRSLLYSADTGAGWDPGAAGAGVDTFLCEASLPPDEEGTFQHLSARQAGALATAIGAGRLVLTHLVPGADAAAQRERAATEFAGPVASAVDGTGPGGSGATIDGADTIVV